MKSRKLSSWSSCARLSEKLHALRKRGIGISIDDFGTGYSSLRYMSKLPVTALKIDRSFIANLIRNADDTAIVTAVIPLAHSLNLKVIAGGSGKRMSNWICSGNSNVMNIRVTCSAVLCRLKIFRHFFYSIAVTCAELATVSRPVICRLALALLL
ncbi:MAG: EAL domain-containing protein [Gammaproteobacteria bacterium]|nr:EAL domain-containing protein [Gammaproteobacteria bacterium]